jgi:hypothetical protein
VRRDPHHRLAGGYQRLLEPPRDSAAVLDRPDALLIEAARPTDGGQLPPLVGSDLALPPHPAGPRFDHRQRV